MTFVHVLGGNPQLDDDPSVAGDHDDGRNGEQEHEAVDVERECGRVVLLLAVENGHRRLVVGEGHLDGRLQTSS